MMKLNQCLPVAPVCASTGTDLYAWYAWVTAKRKARLVMVDAVIASISPPSFLTVSLSVAGLLPIMHPLPSF